MRAAVCFYSVTQGGGANAFALGCYAPAFQAAKKALSLRKPGSNESARPQIRKQHGQPDTSPGALKNFGTSRIPGLAQACLPHKIKKSLQFYKILEYNQFFSSRLRLLSGLATERSEPFFIMKIHGL